MTDSILEWIAARIDDLSDELAKEENAKRRARDENENQALSNRLNRWKNQPSTRSMPRVSASFGASWDFSRTAASAGDSVNELNAEITVEIATVSANCL